MPSSGAQGAAVTLAGFIFGQTSHTYSRRLPLGHRLVQALGFAVLAGLAGALIAGRLLGVLPGPLVTPAGILCLLALATALVTMALTALLGDAGIVVATLVLVILGNATSGGVISASFLPGGFRQLSPALPPGATTRALGRADYFSLWRGAWAGRGAGGLGASPRSRPTGNLRPVRLPMRDGFRPADCRVGS